MYKLGMPLIPQELLGYHLGLIVSKENKHLFWNPRTGKRPKTGFGCQTWKKEFDVNSVFKKLKIPLKVINYPIADFKTKKDLISFIDNGIKKNKDFIVLVGSDALNGTSNNNGHACVVDIIYPKKDIIRLIDPSSIQSKWREFKIDKFIKAMNLHPTCNGRLLELRRIS